MISEEIAGNQDAVDQAAVRRIIGYSSQEVGVDDDLTARENLLLQCSFHHIPKEKAIQRVEQLLETVKLQEAADRRLKTFSGGMRKRLDLASSLVSDPKVLILDEPTTGLDPQSRQDIWEYIAELNRQGMTIFLTTQYMEEADRLSDRLCIVDQGKIVAEGTPLELKARIGADIITLSVRSDDPEACETASTVIAKMEGVKEVGLCSVGISGDKGLTVMAHNGSAIIPQLVRLLDGIGVQIDQLTLSGPTLDEVFLKLTGRALNVVERKGAVKGRGWGKRGKRP
ncbi:MAG: ATP-binding cassette domain-containing protein [Methanomassiliicoccales archaeon]|nr:ATP-binding cassette domain-containing protein [Methanomassiliicoccales archaeon]